MKAKKPPRITGNMIEPVGVAVPPAPARAFFLQVMAMYEDYTCETPEHCAELFDRALGDHLAELDLLHSNQTSDLAFEAEELRGLLADLERDQTTASGSEEAAELAAEIRAEKRALASVERKMQAHADRLAAAKGDLRQFLVALLNHSIHGSDTPPPKY